MKNNIITLLVIFTVGFVTGQTYMNDQNLISEKSLNTENKQLNVIQNQSFYNLSRRQSMSGNAVFIDQVGSNNTGNISVASDDSEVNPLQVGFNNQTNINLRATTIRENVTQLGYNNIFNDFSLHGAQLHTADILQDGSLNKIISTGKNSLSERIQVTQRGVGREAFIIHN